MTTLTAAPEAPPTVDPAAIGVRVKALREAMGLSLRELGVRADVGAATLSQVERGESSPTLAVAARIADGLELTLSQLLRIDEGRHAVIVRRGTGRRSSRSGHEIEELTPPLPGQRADVSLHRLAAGCGDRRRRRSADPRARQPRDGLRASPGEVELVVDGEASPLRAGDSATFDADLSTSPAQLRRRRRAELLAVIAAGLRRS